MSTTRGPAADLTEPDVCALYEAARVLRIAARALREGAAEHERAALACEQVSAWLDQRADRMDV